MECITQGVNKGVALLTDNVDAAVKFTQLQKDSDYGLFTWIKMSEVEKQVGKLEFVGCTEVVNGKQE